MFSRGGNDSFNSAFDRRVTRRGMLRSEYHSANVTGLLNSDVPPSLDVAVAVKDVGVASPGVTGMVSEKTPAHRKQYRILCMDRPRPALRLVSAAATEPKISIRA
jgi:hypothetical protein